MVLRDTAGRHGPIARCSASLRRASPAQPFQRLFSLELAKKKRPRAAHRGGREEASSQGNGCRALLPAGARGNRHTDRPGLPGPDAGRQPSARPGERVRKHHLDVSSLCANAGGAEESASPGLRQSRWFAQLRRHLAFCTAFEGQQVQRLPLVLRQLVQHLFIRES
jgi:hypothetical protein